MDDSQFWNQADAWLDELPHEFGALWAKSGDGESFLSLPQHLLDSACVAVELWDHVVADTLKETLAQQTGLSVEQVKSLYVFLAGTHDIGKAIPQFITCIQDSGDHSYLVDLAKDAGFTMEVNAFGSQATKKVFHNTASGIILKNLLRKSGIHRKIAIGLAEIVDAHHGQPTGAEAVNEAEQILTRIGQGWHDTHKKLFDSMLRLSQVNEVLSTWGQQRRSLKASTTQILTGLVIMADWIASNEDAFPYTPVESQQVRSIAGINAVDLTETWSPQPVPEKIGEAYQIDFNWAEGYSVRPVQRAAFELTQSITSPSLIIIEAPTGEGKTEAALMASHILGRNSAAQGVFFAAPTQATANGLLDRVIQWSERATASGTVSSLFLAHSKRQLNRDYSELRFRSISEDIEDHGDVIASQWMSGNKKGVLSNFVVGTIDQVLLLALQMRHSMLRHVGLAGKVIVIDEAHAYDVYMQAYLHTALAWLRRYGAHVIVLSATLPPEQRKSLVKAYSSEIPGIGSQVAESLELDTPAYPLVTVVNSDGLRVQPVESRPTEATVAIQRIDDDADTLGRILIETLDEGGIGLVICNTIRRAQEATKLLEQDFPGEVTLHHSGFIASHRAEKEEDLLQALGPRSHRGSGRPNRLIVVATQVVEQSLDIDVDVIVTDIAPMDLLIQRIGRLHRHLRPKTDRPAKVQEPKVYVRGIETWDPCPEFDSGTKAIYGDKILLATAANLPYQFRRPDDIAPLVHKVYSENAGIPNDWANRWDQACNDHNTMVDRSQSQAQTFKIPEPHQSDTLLRLFSRPLRTDGSDEEAGHAQVRDTEPTVEVIVIEKTPYGYVPYGADSDTSITDSTEISYKDALYLAGNSLRLPVRMTRYKTDFDEIISQLESGTPSAWRKHHLLRGSVALGLNSEGKVTLGRFSLHYDDDLGLEVT